MHFNIEIIEKQILLFPLIYKKKCALSKTILYLDLICIDNSSNNIIIALSLSTCRPRPTAASAAHQGLLTQPVGSSSATINGSKQATFSVSTNQQAFSSSNAGLTNGSASAGIIAPSTANPQNPFDTAWALRHNTSTNPFISSTAASTNTSTSAAGIQAPTQTQFSKEFELKM